MAESKGTIATTAAIVGIMSAVVGMLIGNTGLLNWAKPHNAPSITTSRTDPSDAPKPAPILPNPEPSAPPPAAKLPRLWRYEMTLDGQHQEYTLSLNPSNKTYAMQMKGIEGLAVGIISGTWLSDGQTISLTPK